MNREQFVMCSCVWDDFISKINVKIWSTLPGRNVCESNMAVVCGT